MRLHGAWLAGALTFVSVSGLIAAENSSADVFARDAHFAFRAGEYKKAAKLFSKAVKLDPANADYRDGLGRAYERQAESSSFPVLLTAKARNNYIRALQLQPDNAGAMADLIELNAQPIGLCAGDLKQASMLVDRLNQVDPAAAKHAKESVTDAQIDAARPGQAALCGPVRLSRAVTDHFIPHPLLQAAVPPRADTSIAQGDQPTIAAAAGSN